MITETQKPKLFQYAVIWHPSEKQIKDEGKKSEVLVQPTTELLKDAAAAAMKAAMSIPATHKDQLDQIEIAVRPF